MSTDQLKLLTVVGARPQFVKAAALSAAIRNHNESLGQVVVSEVLVHTGQHYDVAMSDVFFAQLDLPEPEYHLSIGSGSHGAQTGAMMTAIEAACVAVSPDAMLVYGDTNSTLAGALVAAKLHIPIVHIEAGLRSFDRRMPEEVNRVLTDHVSDILLCPTSLSAGNLAREGICEGVHVVGDIMYDIFRASSRAARPDRLAAWGDLPRPFAVATVHRPDNTDDPSNLKSILNAFSRIADSGLAVVWPVHPRLRSCAADWDLHHNVRTIQPVGYLEMLGLLHGCEVVLTDSGGLQKEAYWSERPCITLRSTTEWGETVDSGWNRLVGHDENAIVEGAMFFRPDGTPPPVYGHGDTSKRILEVILRRYVEQSRQ